MPDQMVEILRDQNGRFSAPRRLLELEADASEESFALQNL